MQKKIIIIGGLIFLIISSIFIKIFLNPLKSKTNKLNATVISKNDDKITLQDENNIIYTFQNDQIKADIGSNIIIEYTGLLDKNTEVQTNYIVDYESIDVMENEDGIPSDWLDNGIFSNYYILAKDYIKNMSLNEKIAQLLLVRYPDTNAIGVTKEYSFGGYVFFEKDFTNKTTKEVQTMMNELQKSSKTPLLTAVDEEGGKVVRVSSNPNLVTSKFLSSKQLYNTGGFDLIKQDTINKSNVLKNLGLNLNLAPVVDVSTDPNDYMYERAFGKGSELTSTYASTVIEASKGTGVSYTLKHFPGYGNNDDTHTGFVTDNRTLESIKTNDLPPFKAGIQAGAEAILVGHQIVTSIDPDNPASLSRSVHNLLRNDLGFTGIIITDNLDMSAITSVADATVQAILAGNNLIITTDYQTSFNSIKQAITDGTISEELINKLAFRIIAWKYYKGLMFEVIK